MIMLTVLCFRKEEYGLKQMLDSKQRQLKELKESKTNRLRRFGQHMPDLCEAIENAHRQRQFKHKPIGPFGNVLTIVALTFVQIVSNKCRYIEIVRCEI